eukprot:TRINITY_DN17577_c4_g1_i1.p1 TRINITY_DN17577_c4_g1~~TRINITY_DN17577_c4_g1_i1.p1  ORF type:complete len:788 (+),score=256.56 TRINITY_DN17577_c4_g1_i1:141-2504(+)
MTAKAAGKGDADNEMIDAEPEIMQAAEVGDVQQEPDPAEVDDPDDILDPEPPPAEVKRRSGMAGVLANMKRLIVQGRELDKMITDQWVCLDSGYDTLREMYEKQPPENPQYELGFGVPPPAPPPSLGVQQQATQCQLDDCLGRISGGHIGLVSGCGECACCEQQKQDASGAHISVQANSAAIAVELKEVGRKMAHILKNWASRQPLSALQTSSTQGGLEMTQLLAAYSRAHGVIDLRRYGCKKAGELLKKCSGQVRTGPHPTRPSPGILYCWAVAEQAPKERKVIPATKVIQYDLNGALLRLCDPAPGMMGVCPKCVEVSPSTSILEWSDYAEGAYAGGWHCENFRLCQARRSTSGDFRWFCKDCQFDLCDGCNKNPNIKEQLAKLARKDLVIKRLKALVEKHEKVRCGDVARMYLESFNDGELSLDDCGVKSVFDIFKSDDFFRVGRRGDTDADTIITVRQPTPPREERKRSSSRDRRRRSRDRRRSRSRDRRSRDRRSRDRRSRDRRRRRSDSGGEQGWGIKGKDIDRVRREKEQQKHAKGALKDAIKRDQADQERLYGKAAVRTRHVSASPSRSRDRDRRGDRDRRDRDRRSRSRSRSRRRRSPDRKRARSDDRRRRSRSDSDRKKKDKRDDKKEKKEDRKDSKGDDTDKKRKQFAHRLREWQKEYAAKHGRQPTQADVDADPEMGQVYKEYVRLKKANKGDGKEKTFKVNLGGGKLGLNLDTALLIEQVNPKGSAAKAGLQKGWRVVAVNDRRVSSQDELRDALKSAGDTFDLVADTRGKAAD